MNDRFKFRVWDKPLKKYMEFKEFKFMNVEFTFNPITKEAEIEYDKERYIVEQCTGLKDKNGQLIYENDLIKCPSGIYRIAVDDFGLWTAIYNNNPIKGVVEWSDMVKEYAFNQENVELEVLGNIHQNPELLKEEE